jgi:hypothetical protein
MESRVEANTLSNPSDWGEACGLDKAGSIKSVKATVHAGVDGIQHFRGRC